MRRDLCFAGLYCVSGVAASTFLQQVDVFADVGGDKIIVELFLTGKESVQLFADGSVLCVKDRAVGYVHKLARVVLFKVLR